MVIRYHDLGIIIHFKVRRLGSFYMTLYIWYLLLRYTLLLYDWPWACLQVRQLMSCRQCKFCALCGFHGALSIFEVAVPVPSHRRWHNVMAMYLHGLMPQCQTMSRILLMCVLHTRGPENKAHGANMSPPWVLSAPDGSMLAPWTLLSGAPAYDCILTQPDYQTHPHMVWNEDRTVFL